MNDWISSWREVHKLSLRWIPTPNVTKRNSRIPNTAFFRVFSFFIFSKGKKRRRIRREERRREKTIPNSNTKMSAEELGRGGRSSSSWTANPTSDDDCNSSLSMEGEEQEEKIEELCASFSFSECIIKAKIEEKLRGGSSSSMAYTITAAKAAELCSNEPNEHRKAKADGEQQNSSKSSGPNPEPCAHGYVGAINKMGGAQPTWFCTKRLTASDVSITQNRLLLPKPDMETLLQRLKPREREELQTSSKGIKAAVIDEMGRRWDTRLNFWASKSYNLNGDWKWLVEKLELCKGDAVKVGVFRYPGESEGGDLGFVLLFESLASKSRETNVKSTPNDS